MPSASSRTNGRRLYAFFKDGDGERLVGHFDRARSDETTFTYAEGAGPTPLSLSLPLAGPHSARAASTYLDNLLPDDARVRERWARERNTEGSDVFSLLTVYGEDVAGAVTLTADDRLPTRSPDPLIEATEDDIAARIASLVKDATSWIDPRARPRFSIGGSQGKFSLAKVGDRWFWPTFETPSTHILKPSSPKHRDLDRLEVACLALARHVGIEAARAEVVEFGGQRTFAVERWDRLAGLRLHAEDMAQALARPVDEKYEVTAPEIAKLLAVQAPTEEWRFVQQLAFNVAVGNADAHAKNYSVLLAGDQVVLSPLYDAIPTVLWPQYDQNLAMPIGRAKRTLDATDRNWRRFADEAGLDADRVSSEALDVMGKVGEAFADYVQIDGLDPARLNLVRKQVRSIRRAAQTASGKP